MTAFWGPLDCLCFGPKRAKYRAVAAAVLSVAESAWGLGEMHAFLEEVFAAVSELRWHVARDVRQVWVSRGNFHEFMPRVPNPRNCHRENAMKHQSL